MVADWFISMADRKGLTVHIDSISRTEFEIDCRDSRAMISLLLRRQRHKSGLSLQEVAHRLGARSRNAYARYEQGRSVPTVEKLDQLLKAVAPERDIVVRESRAA